MEKTELKQHLARLTAKLELVQMMHKRGRATAEELEQATEAVRQLKAAIAIAPEAAQQLKKEVPQLAKAALQAAKAEKQVVLTAEADQLVRDLQQQQAELDRAKRQLSNRLSSVPEGEDAGALVEEILRLRDAWMIKGDEIRYVLQHGALPETPAEAESEFLTSAFLASLPEDKLRLDQLIRNEKSSLSKYRKGLRDAKTDVKKSHYERLISLAEARIAAMSTQLAAML